MLKGRSVCEATVVHEVREESVIQQQPIESSLPTWSKNLHSPLMPMI